MDETDRDKVKEWHEKLQIPPIEGSAPPRDWRTFLTGIAWGYGLAIATVILVIALT